MLIAGVAASALALAGAPPAHAPLTAALPPRSACPGQSSLAAASAVQLRAMRCLINWTRSRAGLPTLRRNSQLDRSSAMRARDIRRCDEFSHTPCGQQFITVFTLVHYFTSGVAVGENLEWGQGRLGTARSAVAHWLASPPHREIIFTPRWRDLGVSRIHGTLFGLANVSVWVAQFGRRG